MRSKSDRRGRKTKAGGDWRRRLSKKNEEGENSKKEKRSVFPITLSLCWPLCTSQSPRKSNENCNQLFLFVRYDTSCLKRFRYSRSQQSLSRVSVVVVIVYKPSGLFRLRVYPFDSLYVFCCPCYPTFSLSLLYPILSFCNKYDTRKLFCNLFWDFTYLLTLIVLESWKG